MILRNAFVEDFFRILFHFFHLGTERFETKKIPSRWDLKFKVTTVGTKPPFLCVFIYTFNFVKPLFTGVLKNIKKQLDTIRCTFYQLNIN